MAIVRKKVNKTPRVRVRKVEGKNATPSVNKRAHELETEQTELEELRAIAEGGWVTRKEFNLLAVNLLNALTDLEARLLAPRTSLWLKIKKFFNQKVW